MLPGYEDLRHFSGYLYEIFFKSYNKDMYNKKLTNINDWMDMYFILFFILADIHFSVFKLTLITGYV